MYQENQQDQENPNTPADDSNSNEVGPGNVNEQRAVLEDQGGVKKKAVSNG